MLNERETERSGSIQTVVMRPRKDFQYKKSAEDFNIEKPRGINI